ncbi:hypothetical protein [Acinetobacter phage AbTZA1]|uniref:Uncharacterized protein n=1 Tax=Acinetobacter phage AbTZA1 TaxID=2500827 RepID=A0A3T0IGP7_9CAUD|nr:hypothetical protein HYP74_gp017 [Acinetobacter phage AbTZA1]AZU98574.1 hypothetical protein [Acinetobacter phage AbTZA1]
MARMIVPIFSMRSYETRKYAVLKDGNFQLHLHRAQPGDLIAVPFNISDMGDLTYLFPDFKFVQFQYGFNADETRQWFWDWNQSNVDEIMRVYNLDTLITDISGYNGVHNFIFNANISKVSSMPRLYIDKYWDKDLETAKSAIRVFVLNHSQKDEFVANGISADKIVVSQKVVNPSVIERYTKRIDHDEIQPLGSNVVFFPFRISDPCYDFMGVAKTCAETGNMLVITDPNDTFIDKKSMLKRMYPNLEIMECKLDKVSYYIVLSQHPTIIYNENPDNVFHPGLGELIYFDANIISDYNIPSIDDILITGDVWQN